MVIFLYTNYVITAGVVLYASCAVAAAKGFPNACYKDEKGIAKDVICPKDKKSVQRHKRVITSLVKAELKQS
jgi:hypothetical protein